MKKYISLALAALMAVSALASCAPARPRLDDAISLASSDATEYAAWLDERLDTFPTDVVVGIGSNETYGIDMTDFEADGYILRSIGNDTLVFGATAEGLDRAVRAYAKAAEAGTAEDLDETYHEGARIKRLTIAGRNIADFTVTYNYDRDSVTSGRYVKTLGNAKYAAEELVRLIEHATGVVLSAVPNTEKVSGPVIAIDYITDGSHGENGFTYEVKDGNLYINGVTDANGCTNGVYYFLEYECGWDALMYGDSDLRDAELVDVPEGTSADVNPIFDSVYLYGGDMEDSFDNDRSAFSQTYKGVIEHACHGMQNYDWSGGYPAWTQICYTSKDKYLTTLDNVLAYIEDNLDAGKIIGETLTTIDISQGDNLKYCYCKDCTQIYGEEGNAHSGAVVRFANRLAEDIEAEGYGGLKYQIFAYHGTNIPCITTCRDDVYVTLCNDGSCQNHKLDGSECYGTSFDMAGMPGFGPLNNKNYAEWMIGWGKICKNVYLWHYAMDHNFGQYTYFRQLYSDFMLMKDAGIKGLFYQQESFGTGLGRLRLQIINMLNYNPDVTEEEFNLLRADIMRREFGDGYEYVLKYISLWNSTETKGCWCCWSYSNLLNIDKYDTELYSSLANEMVENLERAVLVCSSERQELAVKRLLLEVCYRQCVTTYFKAYDANDTETISFLETRYDDFVRYSLENGWNFEIYRPVHYTKKESLQSNLTDAAWIDWIEYRDDLTPEGTTQRPMPDGYETDVPEE